MDVIDDPRGKERALTKIESFAFQLIDLGILAAIGLS
jgi:hypothetical protein